LPNAVLESSIGKDHERHLLGRVCSVGATGIKLRFVELNAKYIKAFGWATISSTIYQTSASGIGDQNLSKIPLDAITGLLQSPRIFVRSSQNVR